MNKNGSDSSNEISAKDLLSRLSRNYSGKDGDRDAGDAFDATMEFVPQSAAKSEEVKQDVPSFDDTKPKSFSKKYKFRKSKKAEPYVDTPVRESAEKVSASSASAVSRADNDIFAPDANIDADELMKKYMPEEDYLRFCAKPDSSSDNDATDADASERGDSESDDLSEIDIPDFAESVEDDDDSDIRDLERLLGGDDDDEEEHIDTSEFEIADSSAGESTDESEDTPADESDADASGDDVSDDLDDDPDEADLNLMIALGMDDELGNISDEEKKEKLGEIEEKNLRTSDKYYGDAEDEADEAPEETAEFTDQEQTKGIYEKYGKKYVSVLTRFIAGAVLAFVLFIFENIGIFGGSMPGLLNIDNYPVSAIMFGLQIALICGALSFDNIVKSFKNFKKSGITPYHMLAASYALAVVFDIALCFATPDSGIATYHFPIAAFAVVCLLLEMLDLKREIFGFNIVSSIRTKYAFEKLPAEKAVAETEAFGDFLPSDPSIYKIRKASFVDGFFKRSKTLSPAKRRAAKAMIIAVVAASVAMTLCGALIGKNFFTGVRAGYLTAAFCMPASLLFAYSYPFYKASKEANAAGCAIIGDISLDEYGSAAAVSFDDKEVFPSTGVKLKSVKVFGNNRIDRIIYNAASVFAKAGGPLADVFDVATMELGKSDDTEILSVKKNGIEAMVDGSRILMGKAEFLRHSGFVPVNDVDDEDVESNDDLSIMYMVFDGDVAAKMYVQYRIDPDFEFIMKSLYKSGICVGIKTLDPNIDDDMLSLKIKLDKYPVRILKSDVTADVAEKESRERTESGIVSKNSVKSLLKTLTLCDKILHITKTASTVSVASSVIGLVIAIALTLLGTVPAVFSLYVFLYQLFWALPTLILTRMLV